MMRFEVWLDESDGEYLAAYAHLAMAESLNEDPNAPKTNCYDFIPPDVDARIYAALAEAALHEEKIQ